MTGGVRWTEEDLTRYRQGDPKVTNATKVVIAVRNPFRLPGMDDRMNKTEASYAMTLEAQRLAGEFLAWKFEPFSLRLAPKTFYRPDFMLVGIGGEITIDEVKGHWEDDARAKFKIAAALFPWWTFRAVMKRRKKQGGGWNIESLR